MPLPELSVDDTGCVSVMLAKVGDGNVAWVLLILEEYTAPSECQIFYHFCVTNLSSI